MSFLAADSPSSAVEFFANYLKQNNIHPPKLILDIGTGKGRNAIYLAELGFELHAADYISSALQRLNHKAESKNLTSKIHTHHINLSDPWPFPDNYFDLAIDCFSSIDIETLPGRQNYLHELHRTLKPGGLALVAVVSANDEFESEMRLTSPGPEPHSTIWPATGKFQKNYTVEEFKEFYKDFEIVYLNEISKPASKSGKNYTATNILSILRKS